MHVASALFSLTKGLNYWIMVKQGPKIQFNFYNIKTDTCVFHFTCRNLVGIISWNRSEKYLERRSVLVHIHGVCGLIPPFSVFISYTNPELNTDKRLFFTYWWGFLNGCKYTLKKKMPLLFSCIGFSNTPCCWLLALVALTRFSSF